MTAAELAAFRDELRLTQAALANVLGVDRTTVIRWEQGRTPIPALAVLAVAGIRHARQSLLGHYPLVAEIYGAMTQLDIDQETAVRLFGVEP